MANSTAARRTVEWFDVRRFPPPWTGVEQIPSSYKMDTTTHTCSVMTEMKAGMKMMGKYKSKEEAEKAMAGMKECHA